MAISAAIPISVYFTCVLIKKLDLLEIDIVKRTSGFK